MQDLNKYTVLHIYVFVFLLNRLVDFFQRMKVVLSLCDAGRHVQEHVEKLKKKFCILAALYYKFNR